MFPDLPSVDVVFVVVVVVDVVVLLLLLLSDIGRAFADAAPDSSKELAAGTGVEASIWSCGGWQSHGAGCRKCLATPLVGGYL